MCGRNAIFAREFFIKKKKNFRKRPKLSFKRYTSYAFRNVNLAKSALLFCGRYFCLFRKSETRAFSLSLAVYVSPKGRSAFVGWCTMSRAR